MCFMRRCPPSVRVRPGRLRPGVSQLRSIDGNLFIAEGANDPLHIVLQVGAASVKVIGISAAV